MAGLHLIRFPNPHYVVTFKSIGESDSLVPCRRTPPTTMLLLFWALSHYLMYVECRAWVVSKTKVLNMRENWMKCWLKPALSPLGGCKVDGILWKPDVLMTMKTRPSKPYETQIFRLWLDRWKISFGEKCLVENCCGNFSAKKFGWKMFGGNFLVDSFHMRLELRPNLMFL